MTSGTEVGCGGRDVSSNGLDNVIGCPPDVDVSTVIDGTGGCDSGTDAVTGRPPEVDDSTVNCGTELWGIGTETITVWLFDVLVSKEIAGGRLPGPEGVETAVEA